MRWNSLAMSALISALALSGLAALFISFQTGLIWLGWREGAVLLLAMGAQILKIDLFTYHHKEPGASSGREQRAFTFGLAGTFLVMGMYGTEVAVVAALLQAVVSALKTRPAWFKSVFNMGLYTTATYVAGEVYVGFGGLTDSWGIGALAACILAVALHFTFQNTCLCLAISLSTGRSFKRVWLDSFTWMVLHQAVIGMVGLLLGRFMGMGMTFLGALLVGSPLLLLRLSYTSFANRIQAYVEQIEQANRRLGTLNEELKTTNNELIQTLGSILDARDRYTYGHSAAVAQYSVAIGEKLHLDQQELERLRLAAFLHDIGKVGIPEAVLFKPGKLDPNEWKIMKTHAEIGYRITRQIHNLAPVAEIIRQHHEWYGGGGYPQGLQGEEILLPARIICVADALDTLISDRPYRAGKPVEVAFQEIRRCTGTQFDPLVVGALEQLMRERGGLWFANSAAPHVAHDALALEVAAAAETS